MRNSEIEGNGSSGPSKVDDRVMPKIIGDGRIQNRAENYNPAMTFYIHNNVGKWLDTYAKGNKQLVLNYLLSEGIKAVESDERACIFVDDLSK